jgi:MinD-like ATPase involved in chromosome partitioning or flagellar assembly
MVMLACPTQDVLTYQFTPPFMQDPGRFLIVNTASKGADLKDALVEYKPQVLVVRSDILPVTDLIDAMAKLSIWQGVALVIVPAAHRDIRGSFDRVGVVRGVFVEPVNWGEITQQAYSEVMTQRAKLASAAPLQQAYVRSGGAVTGTRVVAFLGADGGVGVSTLSEAVAWHLRTMNVHTLLGSFGTPPAAAMHLRLKYLINAMEHYHRPTDGFASAVQQKEGLDVILAPEDPMSYLQMGEEASDSPKSIYSLCMASWTRGYAAVLLDLPQGEGPWMLQSVAAANSAVIIARPTLSDMAGVQHLLKLLLEKLGQSLRISRESIYLVINQSIREKSSFTAAQFFGELAQESPWVPPVVANIPFLPEVIQQQDKRMPPFGAVDDFSAGVRRITDALFPGIDIGRDASRDGGKSGIKIGPIRIK